MFSSGTTTQPSQFSFGTGGQTQAPGPAFGGSFSTTATTTAGFGTTTSTTPGLSFGFGTASSTIGTNPTTSATNPALSFGLPAANVGPTTSAPSFGFGTPATTAAGFGLGTSTVASTPFALANPTQPASLGTSFTLGTSSATPSFSFNTSAPATSTSLNPLTTTTQGSIGLTFPSLLPKSTEATAASTTLTASSAAPSFGLGGLASTTLDTKPKLEGNVTNTGSSSQKETNPKEQQLPNELLQCVEHFKQYIKQQKIYSSEIARCSIKDFERVKSEIDTFHKALITLEREIQMNRCLAEKLKYDTAKGLQHIEMAQRTQETPPGLQYENNAPLQYFRDLVDTFEKEMHTLKIQIESTDKYVRNFGKPASLTSQDLTLGMRRLHETFVALAGRLQSVHSQVESQKELYLNIRKHVFNDQINPFETRTETIVVPKETYIAPKVGSGPTPFNNMVISSVTLSNYQSQPPTATLTGTTMMGGFGSNTFPAVTTQNNPLFGSSTFNYSSNSFQLQKPPTGVKRGKQ